MYKLLFLNMVLILSLAASGCGKQSPNQSSDSANTNGAEVPPLSPSAGGAVVDLTEEQNGGIVALVVNDTVHIQIDGNPTTGFTWEVEKLDVNLLKQMGEPEYTSTSNLMGGGGMFTFTFKALDAGVTHLRLIYHRLFEKTTPPARIFDVTVDIQK